MLAPLQLAWFPEAVTDTRNHLGCPLPLSDLSGLSSQAEEPQVVTFHPRETMTQPSRQQSPPVWVTSTPGQHCQG